MVCILTLIIIFITFSKNRTIDIIISEPITFETVFYPMLFLLFIVKLIPKICDWPNVRFTTTFRIFFLPIKYMNIFHKTEIQTVILRY